jgi:hypothetical protein
MSGKLFDDSDSKGPAALSTPGNPSMAPLGFGEAEEVVASGVAAHREAG